jgi:pimeloyl-ACP methyl ester carboxylesterase
MSMLPTLTRTLLLATVLTLLTAAHTQAQEKLGAPKGKFVDVGDVRLQYLDFGGEGLPVVFIHALYRGASTWTGFAPRFTDQHRVVAITARGVEPSEGTWAPVATRAGDLLAVLDTLGIDRAVFIGNSGPAQDMTYLAEHHLGRVAGLIYLAHAPPVDRIRAADPTGAWEMYRRGAPYPLHSYQPEYLHSLDAEIDVPALTFVSSTGTRGWSQYIDFFMWMAEQVSQGKMPDAVPDGKEDWFDDPEARAFFERLARDEALQKRVQAAWEKDIVPAFRKNEKAFKRAFGDDLRVVPLDVPFVTGYEYMENPPVPIDGNYENMPARIEPPIRSFLNEVRARERSR